MNEWFFLPGTGSPGLSCIKAIKRVVVVDYFVLIANLHGNDRRVSTIVHLVRCVAVTLYVDVEFVSENEVRNNNRVACASDMV